MNAEENLKLFKDPAQWDLAIEPRDRVFAQVDRNRDRWAFAFTAVGLVAAAAVVATTLVLAGGLRPTPPPAAPAPTTTSLPEGAVFDDGSVMNATYGDLASVTDEPEATLGSDSSVPWVVNNSDRPPLELSIAYVAGGRGTDDCGEHLGSEVIETETTVTITAVNSPASNADECVTETRLGGGIVRLEKPLGDRQLIHAPLTAPWDTEPNILDLVPSLDEHAGVEEFAPVYSGTASCFNLFDAETLTRLESDGYQNRGSSIAEKIARDGNEQEAMLFSFLQHGGLTCWWTNSTPYPVTFAYGPISDADAEAARVEFTRSIPDLQADTGDGYERWSNADGTRALAFGNGYWAMVFANTQDGAGMLDEVIANAPAF